MHDSPTHAEWERWLDSHAPRLLLFARQQTRCEADAQDVLQESVVEAWRRRGTEEPPPLALVFATIRRRAMDLARTDGRRANRELAANDPQPVAWFDPRLEDRELGELVQDAMRRLPPVQREVILLKLWGGLTFAEIAAMLAIPQNTAASRYRYGLEELRRSMKGVLAA